MPPYPTFTQIFIACISANCSYLFLFVCFLPTDFCHFLLGTAPYASADSVLASADSVLREKAGCGLSSGQPSSQGSWCCLCCSEHLQISHFCICCIYLPRIYSCSHGKGNPKLVTPSGLESSSSLRDLRSRSQVERVWLREAWPRLDSEVMTSKQKLRKWKQ